MSAYRSINRIAFIDLQGQLCTIAADGSDRRMLTTDNRFFQFPAWSPDGLRIAAIGGDRRSAAIVVSDGTEPESATPIYHGEDGTPIYLYWAPDSAVLSFIAAEGGRFGLYIARTNGGRELLAYGQPCFWSFGPDSSMILAHTNGTLSQGRLRMLTTSGDTLLDMRTPGSFQAPDISAQTYDLAYTAGGPEQKSMLITQQHSTITSQTPYTGSIAFAWHPQGGQIAYTHPYEEEQHWYGPLQLLDPSRNEVRLMVDEEILAFFWSPDGSKIAYLTLAPPRKRREREFGTYSPLTDNDVPVSFHRPAITMSVGVVDVASATARKLGRFEPQALFVNQFLPFFDQYSRSHRIWSPDSSELVLPVVASGEHPKIAVIPCDGSRARIIADGAMAFWSPC